VWLVFPGVRAGVRKERGVKSRAGVRECRGGQGSDTQTKILQGQFDWGYDVEDLIRKRN